MWMKQRLHQDDGRDRVDLLAFSKAAENHTDMP